MRVVVALTLAIDLGGYYLLRAGKLFIQAAGVNNADEEGEKPPSTDRLFAEKLGEQTD